MLAQQTQPQSLLIPAAVDGHGVEVAFGIRNLLKIRKQMGWFLKWGINKTMDFNTKSWSNLDELSGYTHDFGNLHEREWLKKKKPQN